MKNLCFAGVRLYHELQERRGGKPHEEIGRWAEAWGQREGWETVVEGEITDVKDCFWANQGCLEHLGEKRSVNHIWNDICNFGLCTELKLQALKIYTVVN